MTRQKTTQYSTAQHTRQDETKQDLKHDDDCVTVEDEVDNHVNTDEY